jgi:PKD repeat protein
MCRASAILCPIGGTFVVARGKALSSGMRHFTGIGQWTLRIARRGASAVLALAVAAASAPCVAITLAWDPVVHSLLSGYAVYVGTAHGEYTTRYLVGDVTSYAIDDLEDGGTYFFAVTAYDVFYRESDYSNEVRATIPYRAPSVDFVASATSGIAPLALNFAATVQGTATSYLWTFGDGASSVSAAPAHVYRMPGVYDVGVTVAGPGGTAARTKPGYVTVHSAPTAGGGQLAGSLASSPSAVDLTASGTLDWVQWPGGVRKAGVAPQIAGPTLVGRGAVAAPASGLGTLRWSDGTPAVSGTTSDGVLVSGIGRGFAIAVPADTTPRTLTLFVAASSAAGRLSARLSDGSVADFVSSPVRKAGTSWSGVYTLTYRAASAGQALTVEWTQGRGIAMPGGAVPGVSLQAAALAPAASTD